MPLRYFIMDKEPEACEDGGWKTNSKYEKFVRKINELGGEIKERAEKKSKPFVSHYAKIVTQTLSTVDERTLTVWFFFTRTACCTDCRELRRW